MADFSVVLIGGSLFCSRARRVVEESGGSVLSETALPDDVDSLDDVCLLLDGDGKRSVLAGASKKAPCVVLCEDWNAAKRAIELGAHDACIEAEAEQELGRAVWRAVRHFRQQDSCREMAEVQRIVAEVSPFCFWKYDQASGRLSGGDDVCGLFGLDPAQPVSFDAVRRLAHPDDLALLDAGIRRSMRRGKPLDAEFRTILPDGRKHHIRVHAEPWAGPDGKPAGLKGVFLDVTSNKEAELRVERSHTQLLEAQSVARIGSWEMDETGTVEWSGGLLNILGCEEQDLLNGFDSLRRFVHPEDREIYDQANRATMEGWPLDFEYRIITAAGEIRYLQLHRRVELDSAGKVARAFGIARDISSQKRFEQALEKRDAILQAVSSAAGRFLRETGWEEEIGHIIENIGRSAGADTAYVLRDSVGSDGQLLTSLVHEWSAPGFVPLISLPELQEVEYHPRFTRWYERLSTGKAVVGIVRTMPNREREFLEAIGVKSLIAVPISTGEGLWGTMGMLSRREEREWLNVEVEALHMAGDIFGSALMRGRMEEALLTANLAAEEAKVEAEEASKAKSRFLANMSHEIRTPISGMIGLTEMTITTGLKPDQRQNLDMIRDAARSLLNIINDVLDLSKIEAEKMHLQHEDFDLRKAVRRTVKPFETQAEQKGIELDLIIDDDVPSYLHGDHERLGQIIRNLVSNAIKFTDKGHVEVLVENGQTRGDASSVRFKVSDSGIGIPEEQLDTIFDSFTQVDSSRGKRHQGTGLGLAICRELSEMMGGSISVRSRVGRGSTFSFEVWFGPADSIAAVEEEQTGGLPGVFNLKILMAEDNPLNQKFLTHFLTMFGHDVIVANNGLEALELLRRNKTPFDLVLMDIQMPEMDGIETTKAIRQSDGRQFSPDIPIIALTAYAMKGDRDRMLAAGMNDYVTKPVDMELLSAAIARQVRGRRKSPTDGFPCSPPPGIAPARRTEPEQPSTGSAGEGGGEDRADSKSTPFVLDTEALSSRFQGSRELLREIMDIFLRESTERERELVRAVDAGEAREAAVALHAVANLVSHVHALDAMETARRLEREILDGREAEAFAQTAGLIKEFQAIIEAVKEYRKTFQ